MNPGPVARAAAAYFAATFAAGFVLGTMRVLVLAPRIGELRAVLAELPLMIGISWWTAGIALRCWPIAAPRPALATGLLAFVLLIGAELALAVTLFGQTAPQWAAALLRPAGALGLAGQIAFALMPRIVLARS